MSTVGISGLGFGYSVIQHGVPLYTEDEIARFTPEERAPVEELQQTLRDDPRIPAVAIGDLLASALLVAASFLLTARSSSAIWLGRQALLANVLYTVAVLLVALWFVQDHRALCDEALLAIGRVRNQAHGLPPPTEGSSPNALIAMSSVGCYSSVLLCIYAALLWALSRPGVRGFVNPEKVR